MTTIVGLIGKKQSGKDTFADFLVNDHGFVKIAFADSLRDCMTALNPVVFYGERGWVRYNQIIEEVGYNRAKEEYPEVRRLLQVMGTEVVRDIIGENTWTNIAERKFFDAQVKGLPVVVTDVRFPNEHYLVTSRWKGRAVRVFRPSQGTHTDQHPSEISLDDVPVTDVIVNNGTLDDLREAATSLATSVFSQMKRKEFA